MYPENCRDIEGSARRRNGLIMVLQHIGLHIAKTIITLYVENMSNCRVSSA
jgi:hypothetical protein